MLRPWAATNTTTSKSYNRSKQKGARETERLFFGLTFALLSRQGGGPGVSLASTEDLPRFERTGVMMPPHDKIAALLPRRCPKILGSIPSPDLNSSCPYLDLLFFGFA